MQITAELVKDLIAAQFPQWSGLPVRPVEKSGHDNRTFHLGDAMSVRLPSGKAYEAQVQKESRWLPYLQAQLDFPVSAPLAVGQPSAQYPYFWSVNRWVEGCTLLEEPPEDCAALAAALASALKKLQQIDCTGGPEAGAHNFLPRLQPGGLRRRHARRTGRAARPPANRPPRRRLGGLHRRAVHGPRRLGARRYRPRQHFDAGSPLLRAHRLRHPRHRRPRLRLRDGMDVFRGGRAPRFPRRAELRHGCPGARLGAVEIADHLRRREPRFPAGRAPRRA